MKALTCTAPPAPLEQVFRLASSLFCQGGEAARIAVRMSRSLGPWVVIDELERERRRCEATGSWGSWERVSKAIQDRRDALPPRHHPIYRPAVPGAQRAR